MIKSINQGDILILASHDVEPGGLNDILPNPRNTMLGAQPSWETIVVYPPVSNVTAKIGSFQKCDLMLEELTMYRYSNSK